MPGAYSVGNQDRTRPSRIPVHLQIEELARGCVVLELKIARAAVQHKDELLLPLYLCSIPAQVVGVDHLSAFEDDSDILAVVFLQLFPDGRLGHKERGLVLLQIGGQVLLHGADVGFGGRPVFSLGGEEPVEHLVCLRLVCGKCDPIFPFRTRNRLRRAGGEEQQHQNKENFYRFEHGDSPFD